MKAVIYARVASGTEQDQAESITAQIQACRNYAEANGFTVAQEFSDTAASGASLNRPGLNAMRRQIAQGSVEVIIMRDVARLTRSTEDMLALAKEFARYGTRLHTVVDGPVASQLAEPILTAPTGTSRHQRRTIHSSKRPADV